MGVVIVLRSPRAVAASLYARDGLPCNHGWFLWLRHMLEAERSSRGVRRTVVSYEQLLQGWEDVSTHVARALKPVSNLDWSGAEREVEAFLENRLNHFADAFTDTALPPLVEEAYGVFEYMSKGSIKDTEARARLDAISARLDAIDQLVGASLDYTDRQYFQMQVEFDKQRDQSAMIDRLKTDLEEKLNRIERELNKTPEAARRAGAAESELKRMRKYAESLAEDRDRKVQALAERDEAYKTLEANFRASQDELENACSQRDETMEQLRQERENAESLAEDRDRKGQALAERDEAYKTLEANFRASQDELENACSQRDETMEQLRQERENAESLAEDRDRKGQALAERDEAYKTLEANFRASQDELENACSQRDETMEQLRQERENRQRLEHECDMAMQQVVRSRTTLTEVRAVAQEEMKSRTSAAEQALRQEILEHLPSVTGRFNVWIHGTEELLRNDGSDLWDLEFASVDSARWPDPSGREIRICARELVRRGLFDANFVAARSGVSGGTRVGAAKNYLCGGWRQGVDPSALFDSEHYCRETFGTSVADAPGCPLLHYVLSGAREGRSPHPLFDPKWYLSQVPTGLRDSVEPLAHYLNCGWKHNIDPHWAFCVHWYLSRNDDVREAGVEPLSHFLLHGDSEARSPHPFIDIVWYRRSLDANAGNTLLHFVSEGLNTRRSPHPLIDAEYLTSRLGRGMNWFRALVEGRGDVRPNHLFSYAHYLHLNRDVTKNPLVHYVEFGWRERRRTHILFDAGYYALQQKLPADEDPLSHYLRLDSPSRSSAHPMFDDAFYRKRYPDLEGSRYGLFDHFLLHGGREGRNPSRAFDSPYYMSQVELPSGWNPLEHYLFVGKRLGLSPRPANAASAMSGWTWIEGGVEAREDRPAVLLVAHVATGNLFGSERSFLDMVKGLNSTGLVDIVVTLPQEEAGYVARILPFVTGIYVRQYPWWDASRPPDPAAIGAFERLLDVEDRVQVVHVNTMMLREPLIAARNRGRKAVTHVREIIDQDQHLQERIGLDWEEAVSIQHDLADHFICNSAAAQRLYPNDSFVLPNTIDVRRLEEEVARASRALDREEKHPDFIYVGMISSNLEKKGVGDFIELARSVPESSPLRFVLVGPRTEDLERFLADGTPDNLLCPGYFEDAAEAIARLDVIVNFSHFAESFGRTVLEGMAAGKPTIVYDHGALPYLVNHDDSGYIVPYRDFSAALPLLERLAGDPALRERLGQRGREIALSNYDWHCYVERMGEVYEKILNSADKGGAAANDKASHAVQSGAEVTRQVGSVPEVSALAKHDISAERVLPARFDAPAPETPLRIAYFQWHFPVPSETFVLNELRGLVAEDQDVEVYCRQSPFPDFQPDFPISWKRVDTPDDLADELQRSGRNIVHSHFTYPTVTDMVWPACQRAGTKFTFCAHAQDIFKHDNDAKNRIGEVVSSPECLAVFVPGRFHFDYLVERGVPASKIVINPQGIDTNLYPSIDNRHAERATRRLSAVHRFTEKKGLEYAIRAAPRLAELGVEIDLWGYGESADLYRDLIREMGAQNVTVYDGVIDREAMIGIFENSDLFLAPSIRAESGDMDGIPTVVMEAMLCGLPVLTTDVSSLPELVMDGCTGIVCKPKDADSLADAVERFYALPDPAVERMIEAAAAHVRDRFDVSRVMRMAKRVWQQIRLDIVLVTWNNLPELQEVISRLYRHTHLPFHLLICDNESEKGVVDWLESVHEEYDNVTLIHKGRNSFVGPGTNTAVAHGNAEFIVYICGKEGFITQPWWDSAVVNYMTEHPEVGLAGTLCHSPTYLHGRDYPEGISEWSNFRNPEFALENPDRMFGHVQGGFFAMRRKMIDQIGGFSDAVPHSYTDVEFSYYVESCGWKLGEIPHILALFNKTRPNIEARYDELVYAVHPPAMQDRKWADDIAERRVRACNICMATWPRESNIHTARNAARPTKTAAYTVRWPNPA